MRVAEVFNIVHGSFVDGHGIRTTVFLKGCPLRCLWCCNPEGQLPEKELKFSENLCDGCGKCVGACPKSLIRAGETEGQKLLIDRAQCDFCGACIAVCPRGALGGFSETYTVEALFDVIKRDAHYYEVCGGGVTIGGGEPANDPEYLGALVRLCKEAGIHVAIDTSGQTDEAGLSVLKEADLLLFDLKCLEDARHRAFTGVGNETILANLKALDAAGVEIIIRMPLIPGCSEAQDAVEEAGRFLSALKSVTRVDILPYHEYGRVKYAQSGRAYQMDAERLSDERVEEIIRTLEGFGLAVQNGG